MITEVTGDLLDDDADILVNPVNCVGAMGKGLALQFRQRFPAAFHAYKSACDAGRMRLGTVHVYRPLHGPIIVHFPTKGHWRDDSRLPHIEAGLRDLVVTIGDLRKCGIQARSIAVPALGAGLGRLSWEAVRKAVYDALRDVDIDVRLYVPSSGKGR